MADEHCQGTLAPAATRILTVLCCYSLNPCPCGDTDSHRALLLLTPGSSLVHGPQDFTAPLLPMHHAPLPNYFAVFYSIGTRFSPVHFLGPQSRPVSCYAIFEGWLLLSPPPGCFRLPTPFRITLDRNLGTLTVVWVVSLMATKLTPDGLTPDVYGERKFGV